MRFFGCFLYCQQVYYLIKLFQQKMRSSFCINSVSSPNQILKNPLNSSISKQLYSFSKDSRFKDYRVYCDHIYEIPSHFRKSESALRSSKKRLDLTSTSFYQKGENIERFDNRLLKIGPTFSMRPKLKVIDKTMSIESQNDNPGAGRYENPEALSPRGNYFVSKHKKTSYTKFNPPSSIRFFQFKDTNPGPGRYEELNNLNDSGKYSLSKTSGFGKRFFDKERRVVKFQYKAKKNLNPGPGAYRSPSDFGHYDGEVYNHTGGISYLAPNTTRSSRKRF